MADSPEGCGAELCEQGMLICGVIWGACWLLKKLGEKAAEHAVPLTLAGVLVVGIFIAMRIRKASQKNQAAQRKQEDDDERNDRFPNG